MSISKLPGYDALVAAARDALLERRKKDEAWGRFTETEDVDLSDLYESRGEGREELLKLITGQVFAVTDRWLERSDSTFENDEYWRDSELKEAFEDELEEAISSFCELHEIDVDDVREELKDDDDLSVYEVTQGESLHEVEYRFRGRVSAKVELPVQMELKPSMSCMEALAWFRIPVSEWQRALIAHHDAQGHFSSDDAEQGKPSDDEERITPESIMRELEWSVYQAKGHGLVLAEDDTQALCTAAELIRAMDGLTEGRLVLRFDLDEDHIQKVSKAVSRHNGDDASSDRIDIRGATLVVDSDYDEPEGVVLSQPVCVELASLRLAERDYAQRRDVVLPSLAGAQGVVVEAYEWMLENDLFPCGPQPDEVRLTPEQEKHITALLAGLDAYTVDCLQKSYWSAPLLPYCPAPASDPTTLGHALLKALGPISFAEPDPKSPQAQEARWLVEQGADLHLRAGSGGPQAVHLAARNRDFELVRLMLARGADPSATFRLPDDHQVGIWDQVALHAPRWVGYTARRDLVVSMLHDLEAMGCEPQLKFVFALDGTRGRQKDMHQVLAALDDTALSASFVGRLSAQCQGGSPEPLEEALLCALRAPSRALALACVDAGARPSDRCRWRNKSIADVALEISSSAELVDEVRSYAAALDARAAISSILQDISAPLRP